MQNISINFDKHVLETITPPFNLNINYEYLIESPLLKDNYMSKGINFLDFQMQDKITFSSDSSLSLNISQDVFTYFMRCIDLNILYMDL